MRTRTLCTRVRVRGPGRRRRGWIGRGGWMTPGEDRVIPALRARRTERNATRRKNPSESSFYLLAAAPRGHLALGRRPRDPRAADSTPGRQQPLSIPSPPGLFPPA